MWGDLAWLQCIEIYLLLQKTQQTFKALGWADVHKQVRQALFTAASKQQTLQLTAQPVCQQVCQQHSEAACGELDDLVQQVSLWSASGCANTCPQ